jgi:hypothetical protein
MCDKQQSLNLRLGDADDLAAWRQNGVKNAEKDYRF